MEGSPCAQGAAEWHRGTIPTKGALSPPDPPPSPTLGHLSGHRPPAPKTAIFGHAHRHHSGLLMSQATSLPSVPDPINTGTPAAGPQFAELRGHRIPTIGRKGSHSSKASGCPRLRGKAERRLQERRRKRRQRRRGGTISRMVAMAVAHVADGVEPMEVDPPEDQEEPMEVDPPPAWLPWHHYTVLGLPSMTP